MGKQSLRCKSHLLVTPLTVIRGRTLALGETQMCLTITHFWQMLDTWFNNITVSFCWPLNINYILSWINDHEAPLGWRVVVSITIAISLLYKWSHREVKTFAHGCQLRNGRPSPSGYINYCSHCCHKVLDKSNLKREGFLLAHSYRPSWWGSQSGQRKPETQERGNADAQLALALLLQNPDHVMGPPSKNPSQKCPQLVSIVILNPIKLPLFIDHPESSLTSVPLSIKKKA